MALILAATMYLVTRWLGELHPIPAERTLIRLASASVVGFIIGFFVPSLYRGIPSRLLERKELDFDDIVEEEKRAATAIGHDDHRAAA